MESALWSRWSTERREQHLKRLFEYIPKPSETYQKPAKAGIKSNRDASSKFHCLEPEPELLVTRIADKGTITPIKLAKSKNVANNWEITNSNETFDLLNTERSQSRSFALIERNSQHCPKKVKRCEACRFEFNCTDKYVIKTTGVREYRGTSGRLVRQTGNVYLHFLTKYLVKVDTTFKYSSLNIPKRTQKFLKREDIDRLAKRDVKLSRRFCFSLLLSKLVSTGQFLPVDIVTFILFRYIANIAF